MAISTHRSPTLELLKRYKADYDIDVRITSAPSNSGYLVEAIRGPQCLSIAITNLDTLPVFLKVIAATFGGTIPNDVIDMRQEPNIAGPNVLRKLIADKHNQGINPTEAWVTPRQYDNLRKSTALFMQGNVQTARSIQMYGVDIVVKRP